MTFNGQIGRLRPGGQGLTGSHNLSEIPPDALVQATNVTFENGTLQKEGGATRYNSAAISGAPRVIGGFDWWPTTTIQRSIAVLDDGRIRKDDGSGLYATVLATGLLIGGSNPIVPMFVQGGQEALADNKKLFMFSGLNQVKVLSGDGVTFTNITTPPADWATQFPICGANHEDRIWGALGHRVYYSDPDNHEDFTTTEAGQLPIYPGEGEKIVCIYSFKKQLLIFKYPIGIYVLDTTNPDITQWTVSRYSKGVGAAGPAAATDLDDDVLFIDNTGIFHVLSAVREYGDFGFQAASTARKMDTFIRDNCALGRLPYMQCVFYSAKREIHYAIAQKGSTNNDCRVVVDLNMSGQLRWRFSNRDKNNSIWLRKDIDGINRPVIGDDTGTVWLLDNEVRAKDGLGYVSTFQTPSTDLSFIDPSLGAIRKNFKFLELVVEPKGNWNISVDVSYDGKYHETVSYNMGVTGAVLGTFVLGTDMLAADQVVNKKRRITGSGRRISLTGYNQGAGEDFSLGDFLISFSPSNERSPESIP